MLLLLVPLVGSVRDFLQDLPQTVESLRESDELPSWLGDSGAAENVQDGAQEVSVSVPDAISAVLGIAGDFFGVFLASFTILFICLFLLSDITNLKRSLASVLMPGEDDRWLDVWERVTTSISRWAIGVVVIATIAGTTQGMTAWLLGSSYAIALGVIAGLLDMIPNIGATIAGFILVPTLWAEEGVTAAIIMLIVVLVYQQVENNILTPKIQGKAVELSGFFIIVAVTLFGALLGVLGALTAVPLAATIQIFIQELTKARREKVAEARAATAPSSDPAAATPRRSARPARSAVSVIVLAERHLAYVSARAARRRRRSADLAPAGRRRRCDRRPRAAARLVDPTARTRRRSRDSTRRSHRRCSASSPRCSVCCSRSSSSSRTRTTPTPRAT